MLKRNDICHCGSGKKYKKCCMEKDRVIIESEKRDTALVIKKETADRKYKKTIHKLSERLEFLIEKNSEFAELEGQIREVFFDDLVVKNIAANRFFASYFTYDYLIDGVNTLSSFALSMGKFDADEKTLINNCMSSYPSLFEITKIEDREVYIKDLFIDREIYTLDSEILSGFNVGDKILGRPVQIGDIHILIDLTIKIQEEMAKEIYDIIFKAYSENKDKLHSMEYLLSINSLFFYKYMLRFLQLSDYIDEELEDSLSEIEEDISADTVATLLENTIEDIDVLNGSLEIWNKISDKVKYSGYENGWASGLVYYFRKLMCDEQVTQAEIAKIFEVSSSTLAKRSKEIGSIISDL